MDLRHVLDQRKVRDANTQQLNKEEENMFRNHEKNNTWRAHTSRKWQRQRIESAYNDEWCDLHMEKKRNNHTIGSASLWSLTWKMNCASNRSTRCTRPDWSSARARCSFQSSDTASSSTAEEIIDKKLSVSKSPNRQKLKSWQKVPLKRGKKILVWEKQNDVVVAPPMSF